MTQRQLLTIRMAIDEAETALVAKHYKNRIRPDELHQRKANIISEDIKELHWLRKSLENEEIEKAVI